MTLKTDTPSPPARTTLSIPISLVEAVDNYIRAHQPYVRDRSHLAVIAITEFLEREAKKELGS